MKLYAKIGTLKIAYANEKDLIEKVRSQKEELEQQAAKMQEQWERAATAFKSKMTPLRKNIVELQEAFAKLSINSNTQENEQNNSTIPAEVNG